MRMSLVFIFICCFLNIHAQSLRDLSTKNGLPQSFVSGLVQDDSSFVWIGTRNGLARYDGIQFRVFQHDSRDSNTLASNLIIWIRHDQQNKLWIEFESGEIDMMNPVTEKVTHFLKPGHTDSGRLSFIRRGWMVDEQDVFWGIRKGAGLNNYDAHSKKITFFNKINAGFSSDTVRGLLEGKNLGIWILDDRSMNLYDKKNKRFSHFPLPFKQDYGILPDNDAIAIDLHERKNGELMWGDRQHLYFFNPATNHFRIISQPGFAYLGIRWIRTSRDGYDYIENFAQVYRYSDETGLTTIGRGHDEFFGDVKSMLVDHSGLIWLGTNAQGIHLINMETPFFQSYTYRKDFISDMLQQEMGIDIKKTFKWKTEDQVFSQPSYYFRSVYDKRGRLYLALKETVCYADSGQKKYISLPDVPAIAESERLRVGIRGITLMPDGNPLIVGYNGNILFYNPAGKKWISFFESGYIRKNFGADLLPLGITADDHDLWMTTERDGLFKIDLQTKKITRILDNKKEGSLPSNQLLDIKADQRNADLLWIGSYQGLIAFSKKNLTSTVYSLKEGLPDNTIYAILPDSNGKIWVTTNKGISRFDPDTKRVRAFHSIDGLPGDEFNRFHCFALPDGRLSFGGTDGWTVFNPLRLRNDNFEPRLALTDLKINNKDLSFYADRKALQSPVNAMSQITLPYELNTLGFSFAGLEFSQPQDLQYRYRLDGYDNDWIYAGNAHLANYTRIPPGTYTLLVNASNTTGKWSSHIRSLKLKIESPWYSTRMAYLCYCIILAGLTWTFIRFRVSREVMKEEMVLKEKETLQLKELDDMKSKFFSNITHEFRTPLTLIMGPAEQLKKSSSGDPQQSKLADTISNNAKQLLILINRLMDLSKLEAKALQLYEQRGNPADAVGSVVHSFETDAEAKEIRLSFETRSVPMDCWFYADAIERIVYNLVSNALKFTPSGGFVEVILSEKNGALQLIIGDNGIGIDENKVSHIFDRYYQADEYAGMSKQAWDQGTGIGLSLVKELINQMQGTIQVESRVSGEGNSSSGTVFTLSFPYRPGLGEMQTRTVNTTEDFPENQSEAGEKTRQILLVEDSIELAGFIAGILSENYQVTHVVNGAEGQEAALHLMPDLILSDVMMPVMDGYELCKKIKNDIRTAHIPVILLTAKVAQENIITGLTIGADDYLTKPFHPTELLLRIHNLLERQDKLRDRVKAELALPVSQAAPPMEIPQDIFLTRLYEVLDERLDDERFGVEELTAALNMSRSSLHRKLKALTGMSTTEIVRNYRLKKASMLLLEGHSSSDAAYKTGFGSPAYFSKSFREVYGITPGDYVKNIRS